ncbi:hypothetical protein D3C72_2445900 [compost metagenome]
MKLVLNLLKLALRQVVFVEQLPQVQLVGVQRLRGANTAFSQGNELLGSMNARMAFHVLLPAGNDLFRR